MNWEEQKAKERDVPELQFKNGQPRTLKLDLIFDTYDTPEADKESVRRNTPISSLSSRWSTSDKHRPPVCRVVLGQRGSVLQGRGGETGSAIHAFHGRRHARARDVQVHV